MVVTHGDAVNSSVSRLRPWAIVHPVHHTGFTAAYRDEKEGAGPTCSVHAYSVPTLASPNDLIVTAIVELSLQLFSNFRTGCAAKDGAKSNVPRRISHCAEVRMYQP